MPSKRSMPTLLAVCSAAAGLAVGGVPADRMEWFRDAKFGMFIHFGASEQGLGDTDGMSRAFEV